MQYLRTTRWLLVGTAIALAVTGCEAEQPPEAAPAVPQVFAESLVQEDPERYPETQNGYGELTYSEWADNQALEWQLYGDGFAGIDWYEDGESPWQEQWFGDVESGYWQPDSEWYVEPDGEWYAEDPWFVDDPWSQGDFMGQLNDWAGELGGDGEVYPYDGPGTAGWNPNAVPVDTVTMVDPVAQSFTVEMPAGWDSTVFSSGSYADARQTAVSVSPDGNTILFVGDPTTPTYWSPSAMGEMGEPVTDIIDQSDTVEWSEYQLATEWVENWVQQKFGDLDGFMLLGTEDAPDIAQEGMEIMQPQLDVPLTVTSARTYFQYASDAGTMNGMVTGSTVGMPQGWVVLVQGQSTLGNPLDYGPMVQTMARTLKLTDEWKGRQQEYWQNARAESEAFAAQLTANHNANME